MTSDQRQVEELGRGLPVAQQLVDLAAGQGAAADDGDLRPGRDAHRRDEAEDEDGEVAVVQQEVVHVDDICLVGPFRPGAPHGPRRPGRSQAGPPGARPGGAPVGYRHPVPPGPDPATDPTATAATPDGVDLALYDFGGTGPDLLLVHATGFCAGVLLPLAPALRDRFHCLALDLRGHGRSGRPADGDFAWSGFATDVLTAVDALGLSGPVAVRPLLRRGRPPTGRAAATGHLRVALPVRAGGRARPAGARIAVEENPLSGGPGGGARRSRTPRTPSSTSRRSHRSPRSTRPSCSATSRTGSSRCPRTRAATARPIRLRCRRDDEAEVYRHGFANGAFGHLHEVRCPVTFAYGATTDAFGAEAMAADAARVPGAPVEAFADLGHFGPLERPERGGRVGVRAVLGSPGRHTPAVVSAPCPSNPPGRCRRPRCRRSATARSPSGSPPSSGCPTRPTVWTVKGTLVHTALERLFWNHPAGAPVPGGGRGRARRGLGRRSRTTPTSARSSSTTTRPTRFRADAEQLVANYFLLEDPDEVTPVGIELTLEARLGDVRLRGILDRLDRTPDGELVVVDYKTGPGTLPRLRAGQAGRRPALRPALPGGPRPPAGPGQAPPPEGADRHHRRALRAGPAGPADQDPRRVDGHRAGLPRRGLPAEDRPAVPVLPVPRLLPGLRRRPVPGRRGPRARPDRGAA